MSTWLIVTITVIAVFIASMVAVMLMILLAGPPWWDSKDKEEDTHL